MDDLSLTLELTLHGTKKDAAMRLGHLRPDDQTGDAAFEDWEEPLWGKFVTFDEVQII